MNRFILGLGLGVVVATVGCSTWFGIQRTALLGTAPDLKCVERVLEKDKQVSTLGVPDPEGSRRIAYHGAGSPDFDPTFTYREDGRECVLWFSSRGRGLFEFHHGASAAQDAPASNLTAIRKDLARIEASLAGSCEMQELRTGLKEQCRGKHCDEIGAKGTGDSP